MVEWRCHDQGYLNQAVLAVLAASDAACCKLKRTRVSCRPCCKARQVQGDCETSVVGREASK